MLKMDVLTMGQSPTKVDGWEKAEQHASDPYVYRTDYPGAQQYHMSRIKQDVLDTHIAKCEGEIVHQLGPADTN